MFVQFKQAASFLGKDYSKGIHEVPEGVLKHAFFLKMAEAGLVFEVNPAKAETPESLHERQKKLSEKLAKKAEAAIAADEEVKASEPEEMEEPFEMDSEQEEKPAKSKSKKR